MLRQFQANMSNLGRTIGSFFIPILEKVLPVVNGLAIALQRLMVWFANLVGVQIDLSGFGQGYSNATGEVESLTGALEDATKATDKLNRSTRKWDELNNITSKSDSGSGGGAIGGGIDLTGEIGKALEDYQKKWDEAFSNMENKAQSFADNIERAFAPIKTIIQDFVDGDFWKAGLDVSNLVAGIFNFFSDAIKKVNWRKIGIDIGDFLAGLDWTKMLSSVGELIWNAINAAVDLWSASFAAAPIEVGIISAISLLSWSGLGAIIVRRLESIIVPAITGALASISGSTSILAGIASLFTTNLGLIFGAGTFAEIALTFVTGLASAILTAWGGYNLGLSIREVNVGGQTVGEYVDGWVETWYNGILIMENHLNNFVDNWESGWNIIGNQAENMWNGVVHFYSNMLPAWWDRTVSPWFTADRWLKLFNNAKTGLKNGWNSFVNWFQNTALIKWWNNLVGYFNPSKWTFSGIKTGLTTAWNNAIEAIKQLWNNFANWLNGKLTYTVEPVVIGGKQIFGGTTLNLGKIPTFYQGGFVPSTADLFMANENGIPELIGTVGGRTAVASGTEITGISNSIYDTANQQMSLMREEITLLKQILAKSGITTSEVFNAVRSENASFKNRTGRSALA